jgi:hypothetical protein
MFETYGEEHAYVLATLKNPETAKRVWTVIDDNNGSLYYGANYHFINRLGYLITEKPYQNKEDYVQIEGETEN